MYAVRFEKKSLPVLISYTASWGNTESCNSLFTMHFEKELTNEIYTMRVVKIAAWLIILHSAAGERSVLR